MMGLNAKKGVVIAIDGPSGVGKTTVSRLLAQRLHFRYVDTGAMYRALALAAGEAGVDLDSDSALERFCATVSISYDAGVIALNGRDYTRMIRSQKAGELASIVSAKKSVRDFLVSFQRKLGETGPVVMEGRDIGTVVFPDATVKFFLDAPHEIRAQRRHLELTEKGRAKSGAVSKEIADRDRRDTSRANSPLKMAQDAVYIDTGGLTAQEVVERILSEAQKKGVFAGRGK